MTKTEVLVDELVVLLELTAAHPAREWRGAAFLSIGPITSWHEDVAALWRQLLRVPTPWPASHDDRLSILNAIAHLVPGNLLWYYVNDACFTCGRAGHVAGHCTPALASGSRLPQAKRPRGGSGQPRKRRPARPGHDDGADDADDNADSEDGDHSGGDDDSGGGSDETPTPPQPASPGTTPRRPHVLLQRNDEATRPERSTAFNQARSQRLVVPWLPRHGLPEGWAIASCPHGNGKPGKIFTARCMLARVHCLTVLQGNRSDVMVYRKGGGHTRKGAMRMLLSPKGVAALEHVTTSVPSHTLAALAPADGACPLCFQVV